MKKIISIIISFIVAISTLTFLILGVVFKRPPYTTLSWFSFFTNLSNLLLSIASILFIILTIKNIKSKLFEKFYLASTVSTSLTFFTVALFLSVIEALNGGSYFTFFKGETFFTHLINPIIGFVIYCFFLNNYKLSKKQVFIGLIPMAIYSLIYIFHVLIIKVWIDFYHFTLGGRYYLIPLVVLIMFLLTYFISLVSVKIHNRRVKNV